MSRSDKMPSGFVVAIDGPAGSGKSTVAKLTAAEVNLMYIDTGAMYRALTLKALRAGVGPGDAEGLASLAGKTVIEQEQDQAGTGTRTFLDGNDVTAEIRMPDVTAAVSAVSSHPNVRKLLVDKQRYLAGQAERGAIIEGRDVGTVVFPDADVKIFMDAAAGERARRRTRDMAAAGVDADENQIRKAIMERDGLDSSREASPLVKAKDAVVLDTTSLSVEETVAKLVDMVKRKKGA